MILSLHRVLLILLVWLSLYVNICHSMGNSSSSSLSSSKTSSAKSTSATIQQETKTFEVKKNFDIVPAGGASSIMATLPAPAARIADRVKAAIYGMMIGEWLSFLFFSFF